MISDVEAGVSDTNSRNNDEKQQLKKIKIDGSQTRWIVISLVVYFFLAEGFTKTCFGQIVKAVARFFNVSVEMVDWLKVAPSASSAVSSFLMTWMVASGLVGLRRWCLTSAGCITLAFLFIVVAVLNRNYFFMTILGQVFSGTANAINFSLAPLMAARWFPQNEQSTAIALTYAGLNAGNIIGFLVPPRIIQMENSTNVVIDRSPETEPQPVKWPEYVSLSLTAMFSSFLAASVLFGFMSFLFIFNMPSPMQLVTRGTEHNPSQSGYSAVNDNALARKHSTLHVQLNRAKNVTRNLVVTWFQISKSLLSNKTFMIFAIPYSIIMPLCLMWFSLMPHLLTFAKFDNVSFSVTGNDTSSGDMDPNSFNETPGYVMSTFCAGGLLSGIITGKLSQLANFHFEGISCCAAWGAVLASVGVYVGVLTSSIETVFAFTFVIGLCIPIASIALVVLVIKYVTDEDLLTVGTWLTIFSSVSACVLPLFGRLLMENFGYNALHAFQITLLTCVAVFLIFLKRFLQ